MIPPFLLPRFGEKEGFRFFLPKKSPAPEGLTRRMQRRSDGGALRTTIYSHGGLAEGSRQHSPPPPLLCSPGLAVKSDGRTATLSAHLTGDSAPPAKEEKILQVRMCRCRRGICTVVCCRDS